MMSAKVKDEALSPSPVIRGDTDGKKEPYVLLLEQPASKALRFRYICEGRSAGSLPGERTQGNYKTHPTIQVFGYKGPAVVVVSCVTKDPPYRPHPHNLVGREGCDKGVCTMYIDPNTMKCQFQNLGIQCVRKRDIAEALEQRQQIKVDPFQTGFDHKHQPNSIDLNALRLCFQVFIEGDQKNKFVVPLKPIVSEPIYDRKAVSDLSICKMSHCNDTVAGGREVIILCEKVAKENISVRFFEETPEGDLAWEDFGKFQPSDVHKQVAICLRTPRYRTLEVTDVVRCQIQLLRPSDKATSAPRPFEYFPLDPEDPVFAKRKKHSQAEGLRNFLSAAERQSRDQMNHLQIGDLLIGNTIHDPREAAAGAAAAAASTSAGRQVLQAARRKQKSRDGNPGSPVKVENLPVIPTTVLTAPLMSGGEVMDMSRQVDNPAQAYLSLPDGTPLGTLCPRGSFIIPPPPSDSVSMIPSPGESSQQQQQGTGTESLDQILESILKYGSDVPQAVTSEAMSGYAAAMPAGAVGYVLQQEMQLMEGDLQFNSTEFVGNIRLDPLDEAGNMVGLEPRDVTFDTGLEGLTSLSLNSPNFEYREAHQYSPM